MRTRKGGKRFIQVQVAYIVVANNSTSVVNEDEPRPRLAVALNHGVNVEGCETNVHTQSAIPKSQSCSCAVDSIHCLMDSFEVEHDGQSPSLCRDAGDKLECAADAAHPFVLRHGKRGIKRIRDFGNLQHNVERPSRARKLFKNTSFRHTFHGLT